METTSCAAKQQESTPGITPFEIRSPICHTEFPLPGTRLRPADVYTPAFPGESAMAVDVSVVHPLQPSQIATATVTAGAAAQKREASKVKQYEEECSRRAWGFTAFVGVTTGAWGQAAQRFVRALVRAAGCTRNLGLS